MIMKQVKQILIAALALFITACGSSTKDTDFFGPEEKPVKPKVSSTNVVSQNWRLNVGSGSVEGGFAISPALLGANIYAASTDGRIVKVAADSGKVVWSQKLKGLRITAGVGVGGGLVLVGTGDGEIVALNQSDGAVSWRVALSSEILASPAIDSEVVVARTGDGRVYGLSPYDGETIWTISRELPRLTLRGDSEPLLFQGLVVAGFADGTLAAVEAKTGRALWDFPISFPRGTNEIDQLSDIDTKPLLVGNVIYVSSYQEITHALDISAQRIAWSSDVSSFHPIAYDSAYLYLSDKFGLIHQVDRRTGRKVWSQEGLRLYQTSAPIAIGPYVLVGDGDGQLYVLQKTNGGFVGRQGLGAKTLIGEPIIDGDSVYFMDSDGSLRSIRVTTRG